MDEIRVGEYMPGPFSSDENKLAAPFQIFIDLDQLRTSIVPLQLFGGGVSFRDGFSDGR
jgi:hypothetical protein